MLKSTSTLYSALQPAMHTLFCTVFLMMQKHIMLAETQTMFVNVIECITVRIVVSQLSLQCPPKCSNKFWRANYWQYNCNFGGHGRQIQTLQNMRYVTQSARPLSAQSAYIVGIPTMLTWSVTIFASRGQNVNPGSRHQLRILL